jgi:hypothetical protein
MNKMFRITKHNFFHYRWNDYSAMVMTASFLPLIKTRLALRDGRLSDRHPVPYIPACIQALKHFYNL